MKTVNVLTSDPGPTGTFEKVYIYAGATGATGTIPQWVASGTTGPPFKTVIDATAAGLTGSVKAVAIAGYSILNVFVTEDGANHWITEDGANEIVVEG